jgi:magnesium chelatase family protein
LSAAKVSCRLERISGPLLDRADPRSDNIHIEVPRVEYEKLSDDRMGEASEAIRDRVEAARERQR